MNKIIFLFVLLTTVPLFLNAQQVSINNSGADPDPSAILDLSSTEKGVLLPRMKTTRRLAINNPAKGLIVFDTDSNSFWYHNGTDWIDLQAGIPNKLEDRNHDTSIKVDQNGGDDNIYFINGGIPTWRMTDKALEPVSSGSSVFIGIGAGSNDSHTDNRNVFIGENAGNTNLGGFSNIGVGFHSLELNANGDLNTAVGENALSKTTVNGNTAFGALSLRNNTVGKSNTGVGLSALQENTSGSGNVGMGAAALYNNTTQNNLVAVGDSALFNNGRNASLSIHGAGNTAVGHKALFTNTTGAFNSAFGVSALINNETGNNNAAFGLSALHSNVIGSGNAAFGKLSLFSNISGDNNVAMGKEALFSNISGDNNVALGDNSLGNNETGNNNTAIGATALDANISGAGNSALGQGSMSSNSSGNNNVAVGKESLSSNTTGDNNVSLGYNSLRDNQSGENNVAIGKLAGANNITGSGNIFIGTEAGANETGSNKLYIDNTNTNTPLIGGDFQNNQVTINGTIKIRGGNPGEGKVLTSDATGQATWSRPSKSITISPLAIQGSYTAIRYGRPEAVINLSNDPDSYLYYPIQLPIGTNITQIEFYYYDNSLGKNVTFELKKTPLYEFSSSTFLGRSYGHDGVATVTYNDNILIEDGSVYILNIYSTDIANNPTMWNSFALSVTTIKITYTE